MKGKALLRSLKSADPTDLIRVYDSMIVLKNVDTTTEDPTIKDIVKDAYEALKKGDLRGYLYYIERLKDEQNKG